MKLERLEWTRIMQKTLTHEYTQVYTKIIVILVFKFRDSTTINSRLKQELLSLSSAHSVKQMNINKFFKRCCMLSINYEV
jgi:hypothetical protein